ncbi:MAG: TlpA family protein disulfide reductase [Rhodothermales bacterium]|nr:TlpA family protein disulfide reductase [Rhodothermales bacterium]
MSSLLAIGTVTSACEQTNRDQVGAETLASLVEVRPGDIQPLVRATEARGVLVNMWSTWCAPCVEEFPALRRVGRAYGPQGLATLFISTDLAANRGEAISFLKAQGVPMPGYIKAGSDQAFIPALHPEWSGALPATVLFDSQGVARHLWEGSVNLEVLEASIRDLLKEEPREP